MGQVLRNKIFNTEISLSKWILGLVLLLMANAVFSQGYWEKHKVILIGQVTRMANGAPIKDQEVIISSDSTYEPQFTYMNKVFTDHEGYYYDTISFEGLKGALYIKTYDFTQKVHDTTVYFRFNWSMDNILFANFVLPTEPAPSGFQANFKYLKNPNGQNNLEYKFTDISNTTKPVSWYWDFGDDHFSTEQNPYHVFDSAGLYRVSLTVKGISKASNDPVESTIVKIINVRNKGYFHMGGHVFAGSFPIDLGQAFLFKIENNKLVNIDTAYFDETLGFYYFYQLIEGDYIVVADLCPGSNLLDLFHYTYYGDKMHWEEADTIHHYETNYDYDIHLIPSTNSMNGPGAIKGLVTYGYDDEKGKAVPAQNVEIILFDKNKNSRKICHSNSEGFFNLTDLDLQMFQIYAEVTGKYTFPLQIALDENNTSINYVKLTIGNYGVNGSVNSGISENEIQGIASNVYPNPVVEEFHLDINLNEAKSLTVMLYDDRGQLKEQTKNQLTAGRSSLVVDVSKFKAGTYFVAIYSSGLPVTVRKFVKK